MDNEIKRESDEQWKSADFLSFGDDDEVDDDDDESSSSEQPAAAAAQHGDDAFQNQNGGGESLPPWMERPHGDSVNPLVALHNEIVEFCELIAPLPDEIEERERLVERFKKVAYDTFGADKCRVEVFGSQATGMFLPTSDIDLVIQLQKEGEGDNKEDSEAPLSRKAREQKEMDEFDASDISSSASPLIQLADALRESWRGDLSYLEVIANTRVPLVKFTHAPSGVSFDVCFDQETGPKAAVLMKTYLDAMPPLRPLAFVLKAFMEARALNEPYTGGVGSFMLQLMIVSFLQHRERDAYNFRRPSLYNLGCLLVEFFELYGLDFNYVTTGISVRHDGYYFPKGAKDRKEHFHNPSRPSLLALENPLDPTQDVGTPSYRMQTVQRSFDTAFKLLLAQLSEPRVPSVSALATIVPPTQYMKKRAHDRRRHRGAAASSDMDTSSSSSAEIESRKTHPRKRRKLL